MDRPAFQFYPGSWRANTKLRRCSWAARGAWVEILGLMHDSEEYGILRWPLREIVTGVGCPMPLARELVAKQVLKGDDRRLVTAYAYAPTHGGKRGPAVTLVPAQDGPIWFSSRMVRDEYNRMMRGNGSRFSTDPPPKASPIPPFGEAPNPPIGGPPKPQPKAAPKSPPKPGLGGGALSLASELQNREVELRPSGDARAQGGDSHGNGAIGKTEKSTAKSPTAGQHWDRPAYVAATALTLQMARRQGEADGEFRDRVYAAVQARIARTAAA